MKYSNLLPFAAVAATAWLIPDKFTAQQLVVEKKSLPAAPTDEEAPSWWSAVKDTVEDTLDSAFERLDAEIPLFGLDDDDVDEDVFFLDDEAWESPDDHEHPPGRRPGHPPGHRPGHPPGRGRRGHHGFHSNKTLYDLIKSSNHTTKLAKIIDEFDEIKELLKSKDANHTIFVPTDKAFERIPHHRDGDKDGDKDKDDDKDEEKKKKFILAALKYHVVPGLWPVGRVFAHHTLPTALNESRLGDHPQRLRISVSVFGARINFFSRLVARDFFGANGVIHAVDHLLIPPPPVGKIISLLPTQFSTLELAFKKSGLASEIGKVPRAGGTLFAPPNHAWARLGPKLNAFLFSPPGKKYLNALLRYHIVVNQTLYSDELYGKKKDASFGGWSDDELADDQADTNNWPRARRWHVDLPTLLDDKSVAVDFKRWGRFISIVVNGFDRVKVQDGIARDGVIQSVESVLIPPHKHKDGKEAASYENDGISVEELKERLASTVEDEVGEL